jgi:diguanylate cyclase (GGDEF)-like protein
MDAEQLKKLLDIGRQLTETRELNPLLRSAMSLALGFVGAEYGYIVLLHGNELVFRVGLDRHGNDLPVPSEQISRTILDKAISSGQACITADALSMMNTPSVISLKIRSVMCAPLISRGETLGAIYMENRTIKNLFQEEDLKLLEYFSSQSAVCIQNALLNDELEQLVSARTADLEAANLRLHELAITDSLTGLYNRRHFFELAENEIARARRYSHPLALMMLDIDHFKQINDRHGHIVGDNMLQGFSAYLRTCVREVDVIGRYGGEEFIIMLPDTTLVGAAQLAERICSGVRSHSIVFDGRSMTVTASLGVTSWDATQAIGIDKLVEQADQALLSAKQSGRDRVAIFPSA